MIHESSQRSDDRALYHDGDRTIRIDARGLANIYNERGERIACEMAPDDWSRTARREVVL